MFKPEELTLMFMDPLDNIVIKLNKFLITNKFIKSIFS